MALLRRPKVIISALFFFRKILELEEELKVVGNNKKSLEISEQEVSLRANNYFVSFKISIIRIFRRMIGYSIPVHIALFPKLCLSTPKYGPKPIV